MDGNQGYVTTQFVGVMIGAVAAIVGGIFGGLLSGWYSNRKATKNRPILALDFDFARDNVPAKWGGEWPFNGLVLRARLRNTGIHSALNCRVFLVSLVEVHASATTSTEFTSSRQIAWEGWNFEAKAVPIEVNFYVDFLRVSKETEGWRFTFEKALSADSPIFRYRGIYRFNLVAVADNALPAYLTIDVDYPGDWHRLRAWVPSRPAEER